MKVNGKMIKRKEKEFFIGTIDKLFLPINLIIIIIYLLNKNKYIILLIAIF